MFFGCFWGFLWRNVVVVNIGIEETERLKGANPCWTVSTLALHQRVINSWLTATFVEARKEGNAPRYKVYSLEYNLSKSTSIARDVQKRVAQVQDVILIELKFALTIARGVLLEHHS